MLTPREFQKQRSQMLDFYYVTEREFLELIEIIPLDNEPQTYSPKFYNILQSSCGQVENLMRMICDVFDLKHQDDDFPEYRKLLNNNGIVDLQWIVLIKTQDAFHPFEIEKEKETPFWWRGYNRTKHKLPEGLKQGNLKNTIFALGATFTLHYMAYYAQRERNKDDFLNYNRWYNEDIAYTGDGELIYYKHDLPKSKLFYCATRYGSKPIRTPAARVKQNPR